MNKEQPRESWEVEFDKKFGKFQHKNETGLFNHDDYKQFISDLLQQQKEEIKEWAEQEKEKFVDGDAIPFLDLINYLDNLN